MFSNYFTRFFYLGLCLVIGCDIIDGEIKGPEDQQPLTIEIIAGNNQSAAPQTTLDRPLVVRVTNRLGKAVAGEAVYFSLVKGSGELDSSVVYSNEEGQAENSLLLGDTIGDGLIEIRTASATTTSEAKSKLANFQIIAGTGTKLIKYAGDGQTVTVGQQLSQALTVLLLDQYHNPVAGQEIRVLPESLVPVSQQRLITDSQGQANIFIGAVTAVGIYQITVLAAGLSQTFKYYAIADQLNDPSLNFLSAAEYSQCDSNNVARGLTLSKPLAVEVKDLYGNPRSGIEVEFSAVSTNGNDDATVYPSSLLTNEQGLALATVTTDSSATATYTELRASVGSSISYCRFNH